MRLNDRMLLQIMGRFKTVNGTEIVIPHVNYKWWLVPVQVLQTSDSVVHSPRPQHVHPTVNLHDTRRGTITYTHNTSEKQLSRFVVSSMYV